MRKIVLASGNTGKIAEFRQVLQPLGFICYAQTEFQIAEVPEPYPTFIENALTKARNAAQCSGLPALADDSGLCVTALGGLPGVRSARFAGEPRADARNNAQLISRLAECSGQRLSLWSAYYYCVLVLVQHSLDPQPLIAEGRWEGKIITEPRGERGFGYDPHFWLPTLGKTAAELNPAEKNALSHRGQALRHLLQKLS